MFGLGKDKERHEELGVGIGKAHKRIEKLFRELGLAKMKIERLEQRVKKLETCDVSGQNVYRIIEDLKNRMPKGSAVSDHRFDELVAKVSRMENRLAQVYQQDVLNNQ